MERLDCRHAGAPVFALGLLGGENPKMAKELKA